MATIVHVVGARPNYVKVAPLWHAIRASSSATTQYLVGTGQHRRDDMTGQFRRDLGLPEPDWSLGVQAPDRLSQIAGVMTAIEDAYQRARPDIVAVVGDVMIDTLVRHLADASFDRVRNRFQVAPGAYAVCTLHRPSNVDPPEALACLLEAVRQVARRLPVVFPVHPRTRRRMEAAGVSSRSMASTCATRLATWTFSAWRRASLS